jgi:hypothetical protein
MALLGRSLVIILAFLAGSVASGIIISLALVGPDWPALSGDQVERAEFWVLALLAAALTGAVVILPLFLLVVLAEAYRLRSILLYMPTTTAVMVAGYFWSGFSERLDPGTAQLPLAHEALIAASGGIVFGFVYWLLAGRRAGAWRLPQI